MTSTDAPNLETRLTQALAGQYRIERTLGQGGMGTVFLGRDETLDRLVAIKVISPDVGTSAEIRQRFLQEARTVARLRHPNIVPVYAAGEAGGLLYFVMEYVPGESLREHMTSRKTLTADDAVPILSDLALALDYAHAAGIVHRDVKPENVLLDGETGRAMLMDFGVARALASDGRLTGTGFVLGSPRYMSPEQASGDDHLDGRSDLYSLGLIAYEMFTGAPCVDAPTAASVLVKHLTERPMPLATKASAVPDDIALAIDRLLEKSPDARFQRGAAFLAALNGEVFDDKTPQSQLGRTAPTKRRSSRKQRRQLAIGGGVLALMAAVGGGLWYKTKSAVNDKAWLVAPFEVLGSDRSLDWLREGSLNMLTLSLSQWKDLEVTEYERTLDLLRGEGIEESARVGVDQASRIARKVGAGRVVTGQVMSSADSIVVTASLWDLDGNKEDDARVAAVKGTDPRPLFESVASELLNIVGGPGSMSFDLAKQTTNSIDAYRSYLDGLRHLNAWRLKAADSAFDVAIRYDTTFALAYYKKALAMGWIPSFDSTRRIASAKAVEHAGRLPRTQQELVRGHDELTKAFFAGNRIPADTAASRLGFLASRNRLASLVAADSNDAEAWYALADADFHLVYRTPFSVNPDTAVKYYAESLRGFQRTIKLDSTFHLAFSHLVQIYAVASELNSRIVLVGDSLRPAGTAAHEARLGTPAQVATLRSIARNRSREAAAGWLASDPDAIAARRELANAYIALQQPDSAISVLREAMKRRDADRFFEWQIPLIKAQTGLPSAGPEMQAVMNRYPVDSVKKFGVGDRMRTIFSAVTVGGATGMPSLFDRASELLQRTDPVIPGDTMKSKFIMDYYTAGMRVGMGLPMSAGMKSTLAGAVKSFEKTPRFRDLSIPYMVYLETRDTVFSSAVTKFSPNGLPEIDALTAIERGDTNTAMRLADQFPTIDSLRRSPLGMNGMRLMARAEVMQSLGRTRLATEIYESIDPARFTGISNPEPGWPLFVRSYLMRGRLYEQLGERDRAIKAYDRFLTLWKDAEAPLQPQLREARDAIGRLKEANTVPVKGTARGGV